MVEAADAMVKAANVVFVGRGRPRRAGWESS
jgi:microcompartment protein CcmL/EutN